MTETGSPSAAPGLPLSEMKQQFSFAFVKMVASAAGCSIKQHSTDYDGVDLTVYSSDEYAVSSYPNFELQVKCTSQRDLMTADALAWRMDALTESRSWAEEN